LADGSAQWFIENPEMGSLNRIYFGSPENHHAPGVAAADDVSTSLHRLNIDGSCTIKVITAACVLDPLLIQI